MAADEMPMSELGAAIGLLISKQLELQVNSFGLHPGNLVGEDRAEFVRWNVLALEDELHEAMQELKWKPWVDQAVRGAWVDRDAFVDELVDALHFWMNLVLVAGGDGREITERYLAKRQVNAARQTDGYTGDKDEAGRELDRSVRNEFRVFRDVMAETVRDVMAEIEAEPDLTPGQIEHMRRQAENRAALMNATSTRRDEETS